MLLSTALTYSYCRINQRLSTHYECVHYDKQSKQKIVANHYAQHLADHAKHGKASTYYCNHQPFRLSAARQVADVSWNMPISGGRTHTQ